MAMAKETKLGVILVAYGNETIIDQLLERLAETKRPGDQIVLVDNHEQHKTAARAEKHIAVDKVVRSTNIGFGAGCNLGVQQLSKDIDVVFFLNPDTLPAKGALDLIRGPYDKDWAAWMPLLTTKGNKVNTAGSVVHISGLSWVSHYGEDAADFKKPREINFVSGACMLIKKKIFEQIGGFSDLYFMYYEDTDLSLRLKLAGYKLGLMPNAHVEHDYQFKKGNHKFFYLERNRYLLIIRTWPIGVIVVLAPMFIFVELGLWVLSLLERRFFLKLKSSLSFLKIMLPAFRDRHQILNRRKISTLEFFRLLESSTYTPLLGRIGQAKIIRALFNIYYKAAYLILRVTSSI